jgi:hypothetical protein
MDFNGNSFSDCSLWMPDAPVRPKPRWQFDNSIQAAMRGATE